MLVIIGKTLETTQESKALKGLFNKPFWIWNIAEHKLEGIIIIVLVVVVLVNGWVLDLDLLSPVTNLFFMTWQSWEFQFVSNENSDKFDICLLN